MFIVDWEYYNSRFPKLSETDFNMYNYSAEVYVKKHIYKGYDDFTEDEQTTIKDCICNVINYLKFADETRSVSSVSNQGFSVSYAQDDSIGYTLDSVLIRWLGELYDSGYIAI